MIPKSRNFQQIISKWVFCKKRSKRSQCNNSANGLEELRPVSERPQADYNNQVDRKPDEEHIEPELSHPALGDVALEVAGIISHHDCRRSL